MAVCRHAKLMSNLESLIIVYAGHIGIVIGSSSRAELETQSLVRCDPWSHRMLEAYGPTTFAIPTNYRCKYEGFKRLIDRATKYA